MNHPDHICRFNDAPQTCECYDAGYKDGVAGEKARVRGEIEEIHTELHNGRTESAYRMICHFLSSLDTNLK